MALEAERDVDEFAANFFQRIGKDKASGDAIGAAFVLKLYQGK